MQATWVFDDFGRGIAQRDLLMLLASAKLWSIHCPLSRRVLYCSDALGNALVSLGETKIFDELVLLPNREKSIVNSSVFWSYPKVEVLAQLEEPTYLIDHDFMVLENFEEVLPKDKVVFTNIENARNYYPSGYDPRIRSLRYKTRWPGYSANVSFLQLPFPEWTQFYAGTSLQIMEELSVLNAPDSRYLIFAEQMVFWHLLQGNLEWSSLISNEYECKSEAWTQKHTKNGLWTVEEAWGKKFIHYGPQKRSWTKSKYEGELKALCDLAGLSQDLIKKSDYLRK